MPSWITPRRLGATAVLYAVFLGGWYLGQPLPGVGCDTPDPGIAIEEPPLIGEPAELTDDLSRTADAVFTVKVVDTAVLVDCNGSSHPRLLAWLTGDWR